MLVTIRDVYTEMFDRRTMQVQMEKHKGQFQTTQKSEVTGTGKPARKKRATYWDRLRFLDDVEEDRK